MITKIKSKFQSEDKKRLLSNFFSLSILQAFTYVLPLFTLPYLVRVLGIEKFGLVMFAQYFIMFFNILVDYGFNLSATREVSIHRNDKEKLTEVFSAVMSIKFILIGVSLVILSIVVFSFEKFSNNWELYYLTFLMVIGQALFPLWYFQGLERMKYITIVNITSKLIFTIAIFIFIHNKDNYILVPVFNGFGFIIGGIYSLWMIKKFFKQKFVFQSKIILLTYLRDAQHIFYSNIFGNLYVQGNIIILGLFTSNTIVGYYSIAQKLSNVLIQFVQVVKQVLFPYLAKLIKVNKSSFIEISKRILIFGISSAFILILLIESISDKIYIIFSGYNEVIGLYSFSFWLVISFFTIINIILNMLLLVVRKDKSLSKIYIFVGVSFLFYGTILTYFFSTSGMLYSMLLVELSILISSLYILKNTRGIKI